MTYMLVFMTYMLAVVRSPEPALNEESYMLAVVRSPEPALKIKTYASLAEKMMRRIG